MIIKSLENIPISTIRYCFNKAFANYFVPFQVTDDYLLNRWKVAGIDYSLSVGAFDEDELLGFIITGTGMRNGMRNAYNAGTGVLPAARGNGITEFLYEHLFRMLKKKNFESCSLEVIQQNEAAIYVYRNAGFSIYRGLHCFKGSISCSHRLGKEYKVVKLTPDDILRSNITGNYPPAWEQHMDSVLRAPDQFDILGVRHNKELLAYLIYNSQSGHILQFAVHAGHRRKGLGKLLFCEVAGLKDTVYVNNVDESASGTICFLQAAGLKHSISQYEMQKILI